MEDHPTPDEIKKALESIRSYMSRCFDVVNPKQVKAINIRYFKGKAKYSIEYVEQEDLR